MILMLRIIGVIPFLIAITVNVLLLPVIIVANAASRRR